MKKVKFFAAAIAICGAALLGYNAYSNATMTPEERLFQQNLEALTNDESSNPCGGGCNTIGWGVSQILKCDCTYTGWFSSCDSWGC